MIPVTTSDINPVILIDLNPPLIQPNYNGNLDYQITDAQKRVDINKVNSLHNKTVSSDNKRKCANMILAGSCQLGDNCVFDHIFSSTKLQQKSVFENRVKANYTKKMSSVSFNQVHQQSSSKKAPTKKNVICKHFNHNRCKFSKQCKFLHICHNFISGCCGSDKCSSDHVKLCPVLACNNKYCSFAHASPVADVNSPPWGPVPVSLSKDKNCKSHSSFRRSFLVHRTQAKISHQSSSGTAQKLTNPSRSRTILPYPLLPPPSPRIQKSYFLPLTVCCPIPSLLCRKPAIS